MEFDEPVVLPKKIEENEIAEENDDMDRRKFLKTAGVMAGGVILGQSIIAENAEAALSAPSITAVTHANSGAISFTWGAVTGATGYKLYAGTSSGSLTASYDLGDVTTKSYTNLGAGVYYVAFTAYDASTESAKSQQFAITLGLNAPPAITSAVAGRVVYLVWGEIKGASGYKLYYGSSSKRYTGSADLGNLTSKSFSGVGLGTYYLALSTYIGSVEGGLSKETIITVR